MQLPANGFAIGQRQCLFRARASSEPGGPTSRLFVAGVPSDPRAPPLRAPSWAACPPHDTHRSAPRASHGSRQTYRRGAYPPSQGRRPAASCASLRVPWRRGVRKHRWVPARVLAEPTLPCSARRAARERQHSWMGPQHCSSPRSPPERESHLPTSSSTLPLLHSG